MAATRERRLRETVARAKGCLDDLSTPQRKVLSARAGLGAAPPRSRAAVARRFDISVKRVVRLERTGLKRLRTLAREGECRPPSGITVTAGDAAPLATTAETMTSHGAKPAAAGGGFRHATTGAGNAAGSSVSGGARGAGASGGSSPRGGSGADDAPKQGGLAGVTQTNLASGGGISLTIPSILLAFTLAAFGLARMLRRREPIVAGEAAPPAPQRTPWVPWHKSTMTGPSWHDTPPEIQRERDEPPAGEAELWEPSRRQSTR